MHLNIKLIQSIILLIILNTHLIYASDKSSIKKDIPLENDMKQDEAIINKTNDTSININNNNKLLVATEVNKENNFNNTNQSINNNPYLSDLNVDDDIPKNYEAGFVICIVIGMIAIILIACKAYKMRGSRAERRYGVRGDRSAQELTPLPNAIDDDDSDIEDHTLFDRNRIT